MSTALACYCKNKALSSLTGCPYIIDYENNMCQYGQIKLYNKNHNHNTYKDKIISRLLILNFFLRICERSSVAKNVSWFSMYFTTGHL